MRDDQQGLLLLKDRDRIARDLHDLVIQRLFATGMLLQGVNRLGDIPVGARERVEQAVDDLDETIKEIRQTIIALHEPPDGSSVGVRGRVMREASRWAALLGFEPSVRCTGPVDTVIRPFLADQLICVLRECLANTTRHARATTVDVAITASIHTVDLVITDDGTGIPTKVERRSGLDNLIVRAHDLCGSCTISRVDDSGGTRVHWKVPVA